MYTVLQAKQHLIGMGHGSTLNKIRNEYALMERAANAMLLKIDPITTVRKQGLTNVVHSDVFNYAIPTDYKKLVDIVPQDERGTMESGSRTYMLPFDLQKAVKNKTLAIESDNGTKFIRINWRNEHTKLMHNMNSLTTNGTWAVVATATGLTIDELYYYTGGGSIRFDVAATGDGLQNTTLTAVDLTDWDEIADFFVWVYFPSVSAVTSIAMVFGNDLTANYWTCVAQTAQSDGTALRAGWNLVRFPWSTATETGTVAPATVDSLKFTIQSTGGVADVRIDNVFASVGRPFDIKYYSSYLFKSASGTWIPQPTVDTDYVVVDELSYNIWLYECLMLMAQQSQGEDGSFDITFAQGQMETLYRKYSAEYPSESQKAATSYFGLPRFQR